MYTGWDVMRITFVCVCLSRRCIFLFDYSLKIFSHLLRPNINNKKCFHLSCDVWKTSSWVFLSWSPSVTSFSIAVFIFDTVLELLEVQLSVADATCLLAVTFTSQRFVFMHWCQTIPATCNTSQPNLLPPWIHHQRESFTEAASKLVFSLDSVSV